MATTAEDFSFPTFSNTCSWTIDSPPLWRLSPPPSPDSGHKETSKRRIEPTTPSCSQRKSFSCVEEAAAKLSRREGCRSFEDGDEEKEEKMDMLWEDFNEEILRRSHSARLDSDLANMGCVQALRLSKRNGAVVSPRKPTFMVFVKVLKKLFLQHSSHHRSSVKCHNTTRHRPAKQTSPAWL